MFAKKILNSKCPHTVLATVADQWLAITIACHSGADWKKSVEILDLDASLDPGKDRITLDGHFICGVTTKLY